MSRQSRIHFLKTHFKQPSVNASLTPSSRRLARAMVAWIDFSNIDSIIELGPGTWVFTKVLLEKAKPGTKIICIDFEQSYLDMLHQKYGNSLILECTSATLVDEVAKKHNILRPSLVISWLPHYTLSDEHWNVMDTIVKWTAQGTIFRGFSYTPHNLRQVYKWLHIKPKWFVLLNLPPAFVFGIN